MELKRFLINKLILFFMLSTLITIAVSLIGSAFDPEGRFGYDALLVPAGYAALCMLPTLLTYSKRELTPKQMLVRKAIMLVLIEAEILLIAFQSTVIDTQNVRVVLMIAGSVLVIFVLVNLFVWLKNSADAKKLNLDLEKYQKQHE